MPTRVYIGFMKALSVHRRFLDLIEPGSVCRLRLEPAVMYAAKLLAMSSSCRIKVKVVKVDCPVKADC